MLIVGPTNSGKSRFVVDQLYGSFRSKFDYIVLICPTVAHDKTFHRIGENDPRMFVKICMQHEVEIWLKLVNRLSEGTKMLIIFDDCAASKDVKWRTGQLVNLGFSASPYRFQRSDASIRTSNRKVLGSTPDRSTRISFFRVCLCHFLE